MLINKTGNAFVGLINAVILTVPMWALIALVYVVVTRFEIITKFSLTIG